MWQVLTAAARLSSPQRGLACAGLRYHQGAALLSSPFISAVVKAIVQTLMWEKAGQLLR